jgi:hypothetical protein
MSKKTSEMKVICFVTVLNIFLPITLFSQSKKETIINLQHSYDSIFHLLSAERQEHKQDKCTLETRIDSLKLKIKEQILLSSKNESSLHSLNDSLVIALNTAQDNITALTNKIRIHEDELEQINSKYEQKASELKIITEKLSTLQSTYDILWKKVACDSLIKSYKSIWTGSDSLIILPNEKYITARYDGFHCSEVCVFEFSNVEGHFSSGQCYINFYDEQIISFYGGLNDFQSISDLNLIQNETEISARKVELKIDKYIKELIPGKYYQIILTENNDFELLHGYNVNDWTPSDEFIGALKIIKINELNQSFKDRTH